VNLPLSVGFWESSGHPVRAFANEGCSMEKEPNMERKHSCLDQFERDDESKQSLEDLKNETGPSKNLVSRLAEAVVRSITGEK
jgi:hypothetical protein